MNDQIQDKELSLEERARISNEKERAAYQAEQDWQDLKALEQDVPFQRYFLRRIAEKRNALSITIMGGVNFAEYQSLLAVKKAYDDLLALQLADKMAIKKSIPGIQDESLV